MISKSAGLAILIGAVAFGFTLAPADARSVHGKMKDNTYIAPMGNFQCDIGFFNLGETKLDDRFGPNGGTAVFQNMFNVRRIDIEKFEPSLDPGSMNVQTLAALHAGYFSQHVLPLIKETVKDPVVIFQESRAQQPFVYVSVMKLRPPRKSDDDKLRASIQYTDGKFIYVVSIMRELRLSPPFSEKDTKRGREWSERDDADDLLEEAFDVFGRCSFPGVSSVPSES